MANRQRLIFIKIVNKFQLLANNPTIGLQSLARKSGFNHTAMDHSKSVVFVIFGLSLVIAAHYDKGAGNVFPGVLDASNHDGVRGSSI